MKKTFLIALALTLIILVGCGGTENTEPTPAPSEAILSSGENFKITQEHADGVTKYIYTVTDNDGNVLESASCSHQPRAAIVAEGLVGIRFYTDDESFCRYYDVESGKVSKSFFNAFWDNGELVAREEYDLGSLEHRIIVQNIFDADGYYTEQTVDCPALELTVTACEESEDESEIIVEYIYGENDTGGEVRVPIKQA